MTVDMKALARLGAVAALQAIARERAALEAAFPDLRPQHTRRQRPSARAARAKAHWTQQPKNRARMLRITRKMSKARIALQQS